MTGTPFDARVRLEDGDTVLELHGDINRSAQDRLGEVYDTAPAPERRLLLDFEHVDYINSTGIALIVGVLAKARAAGHDVAAYGLTDHYLEIFKITRLSDFMTIYDDDKSAAVAASD
ncbi:MAG: STAS domain-containing protein [Acidimicrobiia bacterium]